MVVESEWRLQPEGEAEVPEIIIVSDAVEGTFVDLDGESRHENISLVKDRRQRSFGRWPTKRSRQEYKVSCSRNRQPENTRSK